MVVAKRLNAMALVQTAAMCVTPMNAARLRPVHRLVNVEKIWTPVVVNGKIAAAPAQTEAMYVTAMNVVRPTVTVGNVVLMVVVVLVDPAEAQSIAPTANVSADRTAAARNAVLMVVAVAVVFAVLVPSV